MILSRNLVIWNAEMSSPWFPYYVPPHSPIRGNICFVLFAVSRIDSGTSLGRKYGRAATPFLIVSRWRLSSTTTFSASMEAFRALCPTRLPGYRYGDDHVSGATGANLYTLVQSTLFSEIVFRLCAVYGSWGTYESVCWQRREERKATAVAFLCELSFGARFVLLRIKIY